MDIKLNERRYDYTFNFLADLPGEEGDGRLSRKFIRYAKWIPAKAVLHGLMVNNHLHPWRYPEPWQMEDVAFLMNNGKTWMSRTWDHEELYHYDLECLIYRDIVVMLRFFSPKYRGRLTWTLPDEDDPDELGWFVDHNKPHRYAHLISRDVRLYLHPDHRQTTLLRGKHKQESLISSSQIVDPKGGDSNPHKLRLVN